MMKGWRENIREFLVLGITMFENGAEDESKSVGESEVFIKRPLIFASITNIVQ
jgi:hypothetical protein